MDSFNMPNEFTQRIIIEWVPLATEDQEKEEKIEISVQDLAPSGEMQADPMTKVVTYFAPDYKTGKLITRIKQPIAVVNYAEPAMKFSRAEPNINNLRMNQRGQVSIQFSDSIVWPDDWQLKFKMDQTSRRLQFDPVFLQFKLADPESGVEYLVDTNKILLQQL